MDKKRILFIYGPLGGGGAERVLIDFLRNIDYERFDVDLAVICRGGVLMDEVPPQVKVIELWNGYSVGYKVALRLSLWLRCNHLFKRKMNGPLLPDIYDLEVSFLEGIPLKLHACRHSKARKATWVHADLYTHRYEASAFFPGEEIAAYNKMDTVVNVSKDCEQAFCRRFPDCKSDLNVIYNPIDRAKIVAMAAGSETHKTGDGFLTVITVGRLTAQKRPDRLLKVARLAKDAHLPVKFKWVGAGELMGEMLSMRDELGLTDTVEFTGFTKNPYQHIAAADIMMVTSDFEGFCLVICEAMCLGVPVISTRTAGPTEIIGNNEFGVLTELDEHSLFDALKKWVKSPEARKAVAAKAQSRPDEYEVQTALNSLYCLVNGSDK